MFMNKFMNIIFFSRLFYPHIGGVEKHVLELGKRLVKKGYKVTVITENYQLLPLSDNIEGIHIVRVNIGPDRRFKKFKIWLELLKKINLIRSASIIHCHDIFFWYLPFKVIFPFKKVYTTFHGYEANEIPSKKSIMMHKISEKLSFGNICVGDFFNKWYGTKPTLVTYGAVDNKLIKEGLESKNSTKDAMFLGRLEEETGIMQYLQSIKDKKIKLDIYGDGNLINKAKEYVKSNNIDATFKGFVFNATDYIKDYKYIFTSRYLGILEAMALKKPVFTEYNNKIKKDYLEMTPFASFISISKDSNQLSVEINKYIQGKSKVNTDKAYEWVKDKTWEEMVKLYLKLWKFK